jgi:apolipoprotein N-acyltransferase
LKLAEGSGARGRWCAALLGALLPLCFAPFHAWYIAFPLFAALFWLWDGQSPREAAWRGFWFGFAAFVTGAYWLYISVHIFGGAPVIVAIVLMLGLFWIMAACIAASGYLAARIGLPPDSPRDSLRDSRWAALRYCLFWPALFVVFEWVRGWIFTGFPWLSVGYGQIDGPLGSWAPLMGVHGVSLVTLMLAGALLSLVRSTRADRVIAVCIFIVVLGATAIIHGRAWTRALPQDLRISLVQGSISQDRKWLPEQRGPTLELYRELTLGLENQDLVVWPEVAVPTLAYLAQDYLDQLAVQARARGMQIYLGVLTMDDASGQYQNSLLGVGRHDAVYHKRHLVPFGEFFPVPDFARRWMRAQGLPSQDTLAGNYTQTALPLGDYLLSPSICYEDAYGAEQLDFLPDAHLLINVSNDAWFGDSIAPDQHLQMARMRALEAGRFMLRATNTGITAVITPTGEVADRLPQFETGVLSAIVQPYSGATPYTRSGNAGILMLCLLLLVPGGYLARRRSVYPLREGSPKE